MSVNTAITIFVNKGDGTIRKRAEVAGPQNCRISEITLAELYYGAAKSSRTAKKIADIGLLLRLFDIVTAPARPAGLWSLQSPPGTERSTTGRVLDLLVGAAAAVRSMTINRRSAGG